MKQIRFFYFSFKLRRYYYAFQSSIITTIALIKLIDFRSKGMVDDIAVGINIQIITYVTLKPVQRAMQLIYSQFCINWLIMNSVFVDIAPTDSEIDIFYIFNF